MTEDVPDTAVAQALATMRGISPVAIACVGAMAVVLFLSNLLFENDGIGSGILLTVITAVLSFAATRHFLSDGRAPSFSPAAMLRDPLFLIFLQLEMLWAVLNAIVERLIESGEALAVLGVGGYILMIFALSKYGTVFPAIVAGGDTSLAAAAERNTVFALFWRLVAASALGLVMFSSLILLPGTAIQLGLGVGAPMGLALMAPFTATISAFVSVLIAVILSKAYQGRYRT